MEIDQLWKNWNEKVKFQKGKKRTCLNIAVESSKPDPKFITVSKWNIKR